MTPELRTALLRAIPWTTQGAFRGLRMAEDQIDAIAPIIDAAIADAGSFEAHCAACRRDALLAAADDLMDENTMHGVHSDYTAALWLRARANEGSTS